MATTILPTGQSPIDIRTSEVRPDDGLPALTLEYPSEPVSVRVCFEVKDGDDVPAGVEVVPELIVKVDPGIAAILLGGTRFELDSLHWHTPSEHWIDGETLPLEVHLVHRSESGDLTVVGVCSEVGGHDEYIAPAFDLIGAFDPAVIGPADGQEVPATMRLDRLLPAQLDTYRYGGSLTTAPFTDGVNWVVVVERLQASDRQVAAHMGLVSAPTPGCGDRPNPPGNARRIQDVAGRTVFHRGA